MGNKTFRLGATMLFLCGSALLSACGGNSTPVGITVSPTTVTIPLGGTQQFAANVTGTATTSVTWQICLVPSPTTIQPTTCSPATNGQTQLASGFGTITSGLNNTPGGFYTAPTSLPPSNGFLVVATSTVDTKTFSQAVVTIGSGVRVAVTPASATIAAGENFQFNAKVTGTTNTGITWEVNGTAGGSVATGFICPSTQITVPCTAGQYFAPPTATSVTIDAVSTFDSSQQGTAAVTVTTVGTPTISSLVPNLVGEGSVQQDVYLTGTNFNSNSVVLIGTAPKPAPTVFISTTMLRATIPSGPLSAAGQLPLVVQSQNGDISTGLTGPAGLTVVPSRPAVVAVTPDTLVPAGTNVGVNVVGGFFSPHTTVQCNGQSVASTLTSTQQLNVTIPGSCTPAPGLYPLVVQNSDVVPPNPPMAAINFAVEPLSSDISTAPSSTFAVGTSPLGIAIDPALNVAVIANTGSNTVSIVNLTTNAPVPGSPVPVGHGPTAVAIDDQITTAVGTLGDHIAAVTNSLDNTLSVIDLTTLAVTTIPLPNVNTPPTPQPVPYGIGINPLTHRGLVALQATNTAVIVDFSNGVPTVVESIGGTLPALGTGTTPAVVVDPRLNWALITPGGAGTINIVDLGRNPGPGINPVDLGRDPVVIASLSISATVQGAGINTETHQVLFADPNGPNDDPVAPSLSTFSLLDESVNSVPFTQSGIPFTNLGLTAAAVNPLANIGIAVNGPANNGYVVDLKNDIVLKTVSGFNSPQAVAVNPVTNTAYIVNQGNNTVSVLPLATTTPNPLQIVESSPSTTFVQNPPAGLTLSIVGNGFTSGSKVVLDGTALPVTLVSSRHITAAIPAGDLATARRYVVYVQTGSAISNATDLTVIQPVAVGTSPVGVAVDPYLDQAVVTNSGSDSISVINLLNGSVLTPQSPSFFATGTTPFGVAILARTGQAVVVNNSSNSVTILDEKGLDGVFNTPITFPLCGQCTLPIGIAINQDTTRAAVTDTVITAGSNTGGLALFDVQGATSETASSDTPVDFLPLGVAIDPGPASDPTQDIAAIATASDTNALDILPLSGGTITRVNGLLLPTGVDFDALNQVFLVTDSSGNNVDFIDPLTSLTLGVVRTGINPTSLDYNFNASTLVTANAASNTLSVLDYLCPPNPNGVSNCPAPQVRTVYDAGSLEPAASQVIGTNSVAIDPRLNLAVQVDQTNNRVLLVPLP